MPYPAPGRGAWRLNGGLLPGKPGSTSKAGYYRLAALGEKFVGMVWATGADTSHDAYCVHLGVKAIQQLVGVEADGWFGHDTHREVIAAQRRLGVDADGIVGRGTMRALLAPLVQSAASANQVPEKVLGGIMVHESALDPAAVGVNGQDHGLVQINLAAHGAQVDLEDALDPEYALHWAAEDLWMVYRTWATRTKADPWDIAIASHNSPLLAKKWAVSGVPPVVTTRPFQIEEYVQKVRAAW